MRRLAPWCLVKYDDEGGEQDKGDDQASDSRN